MHYGSGQQMKRQRRAVFMAAYLAALLTAMFSFADPTPPAGQADQPPAGEADTVAGAAPVTEEQAVVKGDAGDAVAAGEPVAEEMTVAVQPLLAALVPGKNDSHPLWSPSGELLSFERAINGKQEILIAKRDGSVIKRVYYKLTPEGSDMGLAALLPELAQASVSYNAALTWSPRSDRFVFMSNAGEGNYDLYIDSVNANDIRRLTDHPQKDGQADWAPAREEVTFVSGRSGNALVYILDLQSGVTTGITRGADTYLFPRWSPDGRSICVMYGSNSNHDILVVRDIGDAQHTTAALTVWEHDDISPTWSPDGRKLAFYSNYNSAGDPKSWSIIVVNAAGGDPVAEPGLPRLVVAENVVPDVTSGPAWLPDSAHIAYVFNDRTDYNPIMVVDVRDHTRRKLRTGTAINHDISVSRQGIMAFRAQVDQWDQIFLADLTAIKP